MVQATLRMLLAHFPSAVSTFTAASVTGAGAEVQFIHGHFEHAFGGGIRAAEALELHPSTLARWEPGEREPAGRFIGLARAALI